MNLPGDITATTISSSEVNHGVESLPSLEHISTAGIRATIFHADYRLGHGFQTGSSVVPIMRQFFVVFFSYGSVR